DAVSVTFPMRHGALEAIQTAFSASLHCIFRWRLSRCCSLCGPEGFRVGLGVQYAATSRHFIGEDMHGVSKTPAHFFSASYRVEGVGGAEDADGTLEHSFRR